MILTIALGIGLAYIAAVALGFIGMAVIDTAYNAGHSAPQEAPAAPDYAALADAYHAKALATRARKAAKRKAAA